MRLGAHERADGCTRLRVDPARGELEEEEPAPARAASGGYSCPVTRTASAGLAASVVSVLLLGGTGHAAGRPAAPKQTDSCIGRMTRVPCGSRSVTVRSGSTVATVSYQLTDRFGKVDYFVYPRVRITRDGVPSFSEAVPKNVNGLSQYDVEGASNAV